MPALGRLTSTSADSQRITLAATAGPQEVLLFCFDSISPNSVDVTRPNLRQAPILYFPSAARRQGQQGWVALQFVIAPDGTTEPNSILVLEASDTAFVLPARTIIRHELFNPARLRGTAVRALARQFAIFRLK
jgi:hypothetical protein